MSSGALPSGAWSSAGQVSVVHIVSTFTVVLAVAASYRFGMAEPGEKACAGFYRNYEFMEDLEKMRKKDRFPQPRIRVQQKTLNPQTDEGHAICNHPGNL
ncbi:cytochrome c oxidase subunit 6C, partial [Sigmodon hispidus]